LGEGKSEAPGEITTKRKKMKENGGKERQRFGSIEAIGEKYFEKENLQELKRKKTLGGKGLC